MIKAITINGSVKIGVPFQWTNRFGSHVPYYNTLPDEEHFLDGWREVIIPEYDEYTQRKGVIYFVPWDEETETGDYYTYPIIDKSEEELKQELINLIEAQKEEIIQKEIKEKAIKDIQLKEGSEALAVKLAYPLWEGITKADMNSKYTWITATKTIDLYKCILGHLVDGSLPPPTSPNHFTKVTETIIQWVGGINAIKDRLYSFNGKFYRCQQDHLTVAGQDPTKAKQYWVEEKL